MSLRRLLALLVPGAVITLAIAVSAQAPPAPSSDSAAGPKLGGAPTTQQATPQGSEPTAVLKSGKACFFGKQGGLLCERENWFTTAFWSTAPTIHLIDGRVTEKIEKNQKHYSHWHYDAPITAGWHTITAAFFQEIGNMVSMGSDMTVGFTALPQHTYEVDSLITSSTGVGQGKWTLIIVDVTDKNARQIVSRYAFPASEAARDGDLEKVKELLKDDPNLVSSKDESGSTPLHYAAGHGHKDIAELLVASKADVNAKDNDGATPLHLAAQNGHNDVAELLRQRGGQDMWAASGIHDAARTGNFEKVKALLKDHPDLVFSQDKDGDTPLHWAAAKDIAELLLANKAEVNAKDNRGDTPLHSAAFNGHKDVAELLLSVGAAVTAIDIDGKTPLHLAALGGHRDVAELLLAHGADVNAKDNIGATPLLDAIFSRSHDHKEVAELLREHGGHK